MDKSSYKKALLFSFGLFVVTQTLYGCSRTTETQDKTVQNTVEIENSDTQQDVVIVADSVEGKVLTINEAKCIGCGHCVKFASTNFSMNNSSRKAIVISQENIDSSAVATAIGRCPTGAIEIIEA